LRVRFQYHRRDRMVLKRVNALKKIAPTAAARIRSTSQVCIFLTTSLYGRLSYHRKRELRLKRAGSDAGQGGVIGQSGFHNHHRDEREKGGTASTSDRAALSLKATSPSVASSGRAVGNKPDDTTITAAIVPARANLLMAKRIKQTRAAKT
jgi:hypothetical protein